MKLILSRSAPALILTLLGSFAPIIAQESSQFVAIPQGTIALTHATVIDGTGSPSMTDQTILIEGDRITAVGASGSIRIPATANIIDASGKTVIPGLESDCITTLITLAATGERPSCLSPVPGCTSHPA